MPLFRDYSLTGAGGTGQTTTASDAFGRLRTTHPLTLFDSSHRYQDNGLWAEAVTGGASSSFNSAEGCIDMNVGTGASSVIRETKRVFAYQPGKSLLAIISFAFAPAQNDLIQRVGYFGANNGIYLELIGSTLNFVRKSQSLASTTPVARSAWNVDKMDGTGPSRVNLDITKAQLFWVDFEWLGVGTARCGFVVDGKFIHCHSFHHANIVSTTYLTTACLPLRYEIIQAGGSAATLKAICSTVISEGGYELRGKDFTIGTPIGSATAYSMASTSTFYPLVTLRLKSTRLDAIAILNSISVLPVTTGEYQWRLISGGTTAGGTGTWNSHTGSCVEYKLDATSVSGGVVSASGYLSETAQASTTISILKEALFKYQLERDGLAGTASEMTLALAGQFSSSATAYGSVSWEEIAR